MLFLKIGIVYWSMTITDNFESFEKKKHCHDTSYLKKLYLYNKEQC